MLRPCLQQGLLLGDAVLLQLGLALHRHMVPAQLQAAVLDLAQQLVYLLRRPSCQQQALEQQPLCELKEQPQSWPLPLKLWLEWGLLLTGLGSNAAQRPGG